MEIIRHAWWSLQVTDHSVPLLALGSIGSSCIGVANPRLISRDLNLLPDAAFRFHCEDNLFWMEQDEASPIKVCWKCWKVGILQHPLHSRHAHKKRLRKVGTDTGRSRMIILGQRFGLMEVDRITSKPFISPRRTQASEQIS